MLEAGPDTGAHLSPWELEEGPCSPFPVPTQVVTWHSRVLNEPPPSLPGVFVGSWGAKGGLGAGGSAAVPPSNPRPGRPRLPAALGQLEVPPHPRAGLKPPPATPLPRRIPDSTLNGFDQPAHR